MRPVVIVEHFFGWKKGLTDRTFSPVPADTVLYGKTQKNVQSYETWLCNYLFIGNETLPSVYCLHVGNSTSRI